jgi:hypothetical protein
MNSIVATPDRADAAEQLTLLPRADVPVRFRLPEETRQRGLRHIAEIRQVLAARQEGDPTHTPHGAATIVHRLPPRRQRAA